MRRRSETLALTVAAIVLAGMMLPAVVPADPHPGMSSNVVLIGGPGIAQGGLLPTSGGSLNDFTFTNMDPVNVSMANLMAYDTAVLNVASSQMHCTTATLTAGQRQDLIDWVALGNKLIIVDSECATVDYNWMPYPFTTNNPGQQGAQGTLTIVEENWLSSADLTDPHYIDAVHLGTQTDAVGDMNVLTTYDPNWCIDMSGTNITPVTGPVHVYAVYPALTSTRGLMIYNGLDLDYLRPPPNTPDPELTKVWVQELQQNFNPAENLPCLVPVVGISISPLTATNEVGSEHTVTAFLADLNGTPQPDIEVFFEVISGPNMGTSGVCTPNLDCTTDAFGLVSWTYLGDGGIGIDEIEACFFDASGSEVCSQTATKEWTAPPIIEVPFDIKPTSCPNPFNPKSKGVVPVAILGTMDFDVSQIDVATVMLEGVSPVRSEYEDVATPFTGELCDCTTEGPDGYMDLTLKFSNWDLLAVLEPMTNGEERPLTITGQLYDGTAIEGSDCVIFRLGGRVISQEVEPGLVEIDPNPFRSSTRITYALGEPTLVSLTVYDVAGCVVDRLVSESQSAGVHEVTWNAASRPAGVYFYRLQAGAIDETRRVVLVR